MSWPEMGGPGGGRFGLTRGAVAAITAIVAVGVAVSLMMPLVSLTLASRGVSERTIGLVIAVYAGASLIAAPSTTRVASLLGTANAIAAFTVTAALLVPLVWIVHPVAWLVPIMVVYGACISLCFTLSEYWITAATPPERRGFIVGIYATLLSIGFAIGPGTIVALGTTSAAPFLVGSGLLLLAAVPALLARDISPDFRDRPNLRFSTLLYAVPVATIGAFVFAMGESGGFAFLPLWGGHLGYAAATSALLISAMTLGNVVFQIPLGMLADRMDRRLILLACAAIGTIGMAVAWVVADSLLALSAVLFIWGGATAGIYTVGLAHLASRFSGGDLAGANAAFVFCYALGMLVGPLAIGDAMERAPVAGLPLLLGSAFAVYFVIVAWRIVWRAAPAT
jgi:MFS family permease